MSRAGAEAAHVAAGGAVQAGDFGSSLGKVAAAALVHIAAGLFTAVDDIFNLVFVNAGVAHSMQHGQDRGCLGHDVLKHDVSRQVDVDVVGVLDAADQLARMVQGLGMLFVDVLFNLFHGHALGQAAFGSSDQHIRS